MLGDMPAMKVFCAICGILPREDYEASDSLLRPIFSLTRDHWTRGRAAKGTGFSMDLRLYDTLNQGKAHACCRSHPFERGRMYVPCGPTV